MDDLKNWALISASMATIVGIIIALVQYRRSIKLQQAEWYSKLRVRLLDDEKLRRVFAALLDESDEELNEVPRIDLLLAATFIDDVEFLIRSKLLDEREARLAFGYVVMLMMQSSIYRGQIEWDHPGWSGLRNFAERFERNGYN